MAKPVEPRSWSSLAEVLREELDAIRPGWKEAWKSSPPPSRDEAIEPDALRDVYDVIAKQAKTPGGTLSAICLSGGGIRSATFNLGVLQALARADLLHHFDYLSTVSGGGYVGAWLQAWIAREREQARKPGPPGGTDLHVIDGPSASHVAAAAHPAKRPEIDRLRAKRVDPLRIVTTLLCRPGRTPEETRKNEGRVDDPVAPEPQPIDRLREFSNYLTPRKGLFSGDTWTVVAIVLRNLLLNWLVIVPVIAAALMVPQMAYLVATSRVPASAPADVHWARLLSGGALALGFGSSAITHWLRGERRGPRLPADQAARRGARRRRRWLFGGLSLAALLLLMAAAGLFVLAALWSDHPWRMLLGFGTAEGGGLWDHAAWLSTWTVGVPVAGMLTALAIRRSSGRDREPVRRAALVAELLAFAGSGLLAALMLAWLMEGPWEALRGHPPLLTVIGLPILLVVYALSRAIVTGLMSPLEDLGLVEHDGDGGGDSEREWWGRVTGRVLMVAAGWATVSGLVLLGTWLLGAGLERAYEGIHGVLTGAVATVGTVSALVAGLLGKSGDTSSGRRGPGSSTRKELLLAVAAPVTVAAAIVLLALGTAWLGRVSTGDGCFLAVVPTASCEVVARPWEDPLKFLEVFLGLLALGGFSGLFVNVNRFSLHALYCNRLVRAYLGASNIDRRPNPITGFDAEDERVPLSALKPSDGEAARLFPIVNTTLNLLGGERLAWQERRAESFSMTPLFCGNFYEGYRRTEEYGRAGKGVTLATAMAISGAAANPNMGYVSSPAVTFLLGLLNARLGVWLPNTNDCGGRKVDRAGPRFATLHLVKELFGLTTRYARHVNLSDGGHFENLGLYEVVLRRCRFVVVSDAGCDGRAGFGDLGNAIRKIRIDFGVPIEFQDEIEIPARAGPGEKPPAGLYCAVARIRYDIPDGSEAGEGTLVYLKPTIGAGPNGPIPYDVRAYANASAAFPHESTVDQWFSEAQFESYHALGAHLVESLLGKKPLQSLGELEDCMRWYVEHREPMEATARADEVAAAARAGPPLNAPAEAAPPPPVGEANAPDGRRNGPGQRSGP